MINLLPFNEIQFAAVASAGTIETGLGTVEA
jgi:hypothetical protein